MTKNHVSGSCWLVVGYSWSSLVIIGVNMGDYGRFLVFIYKFVTAICYNAIFCGFLLFIACSEILLTF